MTVSIENFLKVIYNQSRLSVADTRLSTIAGLLNITNAAATDMARKLSTKKLVDYTKYKPLKLTEAGHKLALNVIRKHRIWETFLYHTLDLSLHEVHREAEHLEHLTSDFLVDKMEKYLGFPSVDPHGDPIPGFHAETESNSSQEILSDAKPGSPYLVTRLFSSEKDFFDFCSSNGITIGATLWVEKQYDNKKMTEIIVNQNKIILNEDFTNIIYVKPVPKE